MAASPRQLRRELFVLVSSLVAVLALWSAGRRLADAAGIDCDDYASPGWQGRWFQTRVERDLGSPLVATRPARFLDSFSTECHGTLRIPRSADFTFGVASRHGAELWIDDSLVVRVPGSGLKRASGTTHLPAGQHRLRFRYDHRGGADEPEILMARAGRPLRPPNAMYVSRQPLPDAAYLLLVPARAVVVVPLLWIGFAVYRLRSSLHRVGRTIGPVLVRWHHAVAGSTPRALALIVGVAVAARVALTIGTYPILWPDSRQYYETALLNLKGDFLSHSLYTTPLFPAFMAAFLAVDITPAAGALMIATQRALAIGATVLVYRLARHAFDRNVALYATLLWTVSVVQLYYETAVTSEALFVVMLIITVFAASRMLRSPSLVTSGTVGLLTAIATLTRPVAKGLVFIVIAVMLWQARERRRVVVPCVVMLGTFCLAMAPWLYVNRQTYGFWGISRGEGLWLFLRAIDIDQLDPPAQTRYPVVREVFDELRRTEPYLHYPVRDDLNYNRGYSAVQADDSMFGFALETVVAHPVAFALGTIKQGVLLIINPYRSVGICESPHGPHLCAERGVGYSFRAFPNSPFPGFKPLKTAIAAYFRAAYWVIPLLAPFAAVGLIRSMREKDTRVGLRALLVAIVIYLTVITALFNTVQDRYRLPVDAFLLMFAIDELRRLLARFTAAP